MFDQYTSKPVTIRAHQWDGTGEDANKILDHISKSGGTAMYRPGRIEKQMVDHEPGVIEVFIPASITIDTLEGAMKAAAQDWIIQGTEDEFYPCKPSVFERKYEATS